MTSLDTGLQLAKSLEACARITLIDRKSYFEHVVANVRMTWQPSLAEKTLIPFCDVIKQGNFLQGRVQDITENEVVLDSGELVSFDYLVLAVGSSSPSSLTKAEESDVDIEIRKKALQSCSAKINAANSIIIVGGGPSGIEIAAEIITIFPSKRVTIIHNHDRILQTFTEKASKKAHDFLVSRGVRIILNDKLLQTKPVENGIHHTSNGEMITADCIIWCTGVRSNAGFLRNTTYLRDCVNEKDEVKVDECFRVKGKSRNIFAIGDCTDVQELKLAFLCKKHANFLAAYLKQVSCYHH